MNYFSTIGLEIHAELKTRSKMFCGCKNDPDEKKPNINICPVCMAHPGAIPVPNGAAIASVVSVGLAIGGTIADFTEFDRKNYFYPDIPKGYQISQYKYPIVSGGKLGAMEVTRVHLEEDTATSKHDRGEYSLIDYNRAGVPLMELVTEPHTFDSIEEAAQVGGAFGRELQLLFWYLGVSEANLEKGEMRVEANISISPFREVYGTKVEVKNLNSFKSVERAIQHELQRMHDLYLEGREAEIVQETRGFDEATGTTFSQRAKENAQDYRYFPDPDIPKYMLNEVFDIEEMRKNLPELPSQKRARYASDYGIKVDDIETYVAEPELSLWFETIASIVQTPEKLKIASNYIISDFLGLRKSNPDLIYPSAEHFAQLVTMITENKISSRAAKDILAQMVIVDEAPMKIAEEKDLLQKNDEGALKEMAAKVLSANPAMVEEYKGGKEALLQFFVGQVMKESKGSANPGLAAKILKELLA